MSETLQLGWAVDFLDSPAEGLDFRYWSGRGELTVGTGDDAVVYEGTNGVIKIEPPREASGEAVRMSIEMDASDSAVRQQLQRDIGPLRVRVRWLFYNNAMESGNDGITPLTNRANYWSGDNVMLYPMTENNITSGISNVVEPVRFRSVGVETNFEVGTTYYVRYISNIYGSQDWSILCFFDTEANATSATNLPWGRGQPGRITFSGDGTDVVLGRFDASEYIAPTVGGWELTGKEFRGRLSSPVLEGATYKLDIESLISDIDRGRVINWSNDTQQSRYPNDKGMAYIKDYNEGIDTKWPPS